jgi:hypothetical protein
MDAIETERAWREKALARGRARQGAAARGRGALARGLDLASARSALAHSLWMARLERRAARAAGHDEWSAPRVRDWLASAEIAGRALDDALGELAAERGARHESDRGTTILVGLVGRRCRPCSLRND